MATLRLTDLIFCLQRKTLSSKMRRHKSDMLRHPEPSFIPGTLAAAPPLLHDSYSFTLLRFKFSFPGATVADAVLMVTGKLWCWRCGEFRALLRGTPAVAFRGEGSINDSCSLGWRSGGALSQALQCRSYQGFQIPVFINTCHCSLQLCMHKPWVCVHKQWAWGPLVTSSVFRK